MSETNEASPAANGGDLERLVMRQQSLFTGLTVMVIYCGKPLILSADDIESGKSRIQIFDDNGNKIKGDAGLIGRRLIDGIDA